MGEEDLDFNFDDFDDSDGGTGDMGLDDLNLDDISDDSGDESFDFDSPDELGAGDNLFQESEDEKTGESAGDDFNMGDLDLDGMGTEEESSDAGGDENSEELMDLDISGEMGDMDLTEEADTEEISGEIEEMDLSDEMGKMDLSTDSEELDMSSDSEELDLDADLSGEIDATDDFGGELEDLGGGLESSPEETDGLGLEENVSESFDEDFSDAGEEFTEAESEAFDEFDYGDDTLDDSLDDNVLEGVEESETLISNEEPESAPLDVDGLEDGLQQEEGLETEVIGTQKDELKDQDEAELDLEQEVIDSSSQEIEELPEETFEEEMIDESMEMEQEESTEEDDLLLDDSSMDDMSNEMESLSIDDGESDFDVEEEMPAGDFDNISESVPDTIIEEEITAPVEEIPTKEPIPINNVSQEPAQPEPEKETPSIAIPENVQKDMPHLGSELLLQVPHELTVEVGRTKLTGEEITEITYGSVIELEKCLGDPVELVLNGKVVAYGEVVVINKEKLGIRIIGIVQD